MSKSLEISKHITLGATSLWLNLPFLLFLTKPNIIMLSKDVINKRNTVFTLLLMKTMVISALNWKPSYIFSNRNPFIKLDKILAKTLFSFVLYYKISQPGTKLKLGSQLSSQLSSPILIIISFLMSQYHSKANNHFEQTMFHLLFRHIGFIWTTQLIDKKAYAKTMPISVFYWINSTYMFYKYRKIRTNLNIDNIYYIECGYIYLYSIISYFYSFKILA